MDVNLPMTAPVNNNIQTSLSDRLDAVIFEKIRVANTQLDTRLSIQEKIINKYRQDVEKLHAHQTQRLKREVKKIRQKKPDYVFDDSEISTNRSRNPTETGRQRCLSEPSNLSYCRRYYSHHYNVKDTSRKDKRERDVKKSSENDFFNMRLRLYYVNMMNNGHAYQNSHLDHNVSGEHRHNSTDHFDDLGQSHQTQYFTQTSVYDENEDVFEKENCNFRRENESKKPNEYNVNETDFDNTNGDIAQMMKETENDGRRQRTDFHKDQDTRDSFANISLGESWGRQRNRGRRSKRKKIMGSGSEEEIEYIKAERRKSKHAFEKIFAGLL